MKNTVKDSKLKNGKMVSVSAVNIHSSVSVPQSQSSNEGKSPSTNYLKSAAEHLLTWMEKIKAEEPTPSNIQAACGLAKEMCNVVRANIELKKSGF